MKNTIQHTKKMLFVLACCTAAMTLPMECTTCRGWCSFERIGCKIDRALHNAFGNHGATSEIVVHDVVNRDNALEIAITLPHINHNSLRVDIDGDQLHVSAVLEQEECKERLELFVCDDELSYSVDSERGSKDSRQVYSGSSAQALPDVVYVERAEASVEGDKLVLVLPKKVARKQVTILRKEANAIAQKVCEPNKQDLCIEHDPCDLDLK